MVWPKRTCVKQTVGWAFGYATFTLAQSEHAQGMLHLPWVCLVSHCIMLCLLELAQDLNYHPWQTL